MVTVPDPVKRVVHAGSRTVGRLSANARMLPSFLIAGGQRCGTTSMYRALAAHPAVVKAVLHKGVHYFDVGYRHGFAWYRGHFPLRRTGERVSAAVGARAQTFESSPYYMYHPLAAERIAAALPEVRLVVLVRDPVERAYSQHAHEVARGFETVGDFGVALALEPARLAGQEARLRADPSYHGHSHQHHAYRERGRYVEHLERLAGVFGPNRVHVVDSERFFAEPEPVYDGVLDFLGLPQLGYPAFERHNARPRSPLPAALRAELTNHFQPYDERLADWLGHRPSYLDQR